VTGVTARGNGGVLKCGLRRRDGEGVLKKVEEVEDGLERQKV
jgi:hypothetical protein